MMRGHKDSVDSVTLDAKKKLKEKYHSDMKKGRDRVQQFLGPQDLIKTAPYKLAYTITKHKMPFSSCDAFIEYAKAADPDSVVFQKMASSRQTITRKSVDIQQKMIRADVVSDVMCCWNNKERLNPKLFIQRCSTHTDVLVAKD